jgi:hypothetical protein
MATFISGLSGQPDAKLWGGHEVDAADSTYQNGTSSFVKRIMVGMRMPNGNIFQCVEERQDPDDDATRAITGRLSLDNGYSFGRPFTVYQLTTFNNAVKWVTLGAIVANRNGRVFLLWNEKNFSGGLTTGTPYSQYSDDNGVTWSTRSAIANIVKVNNSSPAGMPSWATAGTNSAWNWYNFGPGKGRLVTEGANAGRMIVPCNHRYTEGGTGWAHFIYSDDDGATWALGPGYSEVAGTSDNTNETSVIELPGTGGMMYANSRFNTGGNANNRGVSLFTSTDMTATLPTVALMTSNGSTAITVNSAMGDLETDAAGNIWHTHTVDTGARQRGRVMIATPTDRDGGGLPIFPTERSHWYGPHAYSLMYDAGGGVMGLVSETSEDSSNALGTDLLAGTQYVRHWKIDKDWYDNEATNPARALWLFNDGTAGVATNTLGTQLRNWSGYAPGGRGGAGATFHADGLVFGGSGAGVRLCEAVGSNAGNMGDPGLTSSMTYQGVFKFPASIGAIGTIFDNNNGSGKRVSATIGTDGKVTFLVNDGVTSTTTVTTALGYNDDAWHSWGFTWTRAAGIKIWVDGVNVASAANTLSGSIAIIGGQNFMVGSRANGNNPLPAGTYCYLFEICRSALTSFYDQSYSKPSAQSRSGFITPTPPSLPSLTNCKLWLDAPAYAGLYSTERFAGYDWDARPVQRGQAFQSVYDHAFSKFWSTGTNFRTRWWDYDADVGWHVRPVTNASYLRAATTDYDFMHVNGQFTWLMLVKFVASSGTQILIDCCNNSNSANPGYCIYRENTNGRIGVLLSKGDNISPRFNEVPSTGGQLTVGTWYFLAVRADFANVLGGGSKVTIHTASIASMGAPSSLAKATSSASIVSTATASTQPIRIGARSDDGSSQANIRCANIMLYSDPLTDAEILARAQWMVTTGSQQPSLGGLQRLRRLGIGVGVGI